MRKKYIFGKKLYISVLTSMLVLLTTVATTFAWVGVFANSTFENFDVKIKASSLEEYTVEISTDGINFRSEISFEELKKQILYNWGYTNVDSFSDSKINSIYATLNQDQCTTTPVLSGNKIQKFGDFVDIQGNPTSKYYKFDIYISAQKNYDKGSSSNFYMDVYLDDGLLKGTKKSYILKNPYAFPIDFINPYDSYSSKSFFEDLGYRTIQSGEIIRNPRVDSASAARIGIEKYEVVEKGHPEKYTETSEPVSALIFQDSYEYPLYNEEEQLYDFGGILPDNYNLAIGYYNSTEYEYYKYGIKSVSVPLEILSSRSVNGNTPDIRLSSKTNQIIDSTNIEEQVGINTMMKMSIYFWFEGWDADCFPVINQAPVNINIGLLMTNEEEF